MNIQTRNHSENQVIISTEDLRKLVEIAEKVERIEVVQELQTKKLKRKKTHLRGNF